MKWVVWDIVILIRRSEVKWSDVVVTWWSSQRVLSMVGLVDACQRPCPSTSPVFSWALSSSPSDLPPTTRPRPCLAWPTEPPVWRCSTTWTTSRRSAPSSPARCLSTTSWSPPGRSSGGAVGSQARLSSALWWVSWGSLQSVMATWCPSHYSNQILMVTTWTFWTMGYLIRILVSFSTALVTCVSL